MFHNYFEKNDKVLTFNIVNFPNFEIKCFPLLSAARNSFKIYEGLGAIIRGSTALLIFILFYYLISTLMFFLHSLTKILRQVKKILVELIYRLLYNTINQLV